VGTFLFAARPRRVSRRKDYKNGWAETRSRSLSAVAHPFQRSHLLVWRQAVRSLRV